MPRGVYDRRKAKKRAPAAPAQRPQVRTPVQPSAAAPATPAPDAQPTARTLRLIEAVLEPFRAFVDDFAVITQSRDELAPAFMRAFDAWKADTAGSFVGFVVYLDATVPTDRAGYRANPVYQAADYLRRKAAAAALPQRETPEGERPVSPMVALARLIATILPMLGEQQPALWSAFVAEMHWSEAQIARLQTIVNKEGPIVVPTPGRRATNGYTSHVPPAPSAALRLAAMPQKTGTGGR